MFDKWNAISPWQETVEKLATLQVCEVIYSEEGGLKKKMESFRKCWARGESLFIKNVIKIRNFHFCTTGCWHIPLLKWNLLHLESLNLSAFATGPIFLSLLNYRSRRKNTLCHWRLLKHCRACLAISAPVLKCSISCSPSPQPLTPVRRMTDVVPAHICVSSITTALRPAPVHTSWSSLPTSSRASVGQNLRPCLPPFPAQST